MASDKKRKPRLGASCISPDAEARDLSTCLVCGVDILDPTRGRAKSPIHMCGLCLALEPSQAELDAVESEIDSVAGVSSLYVRLCNQGRGIGRKRVYAAVHKLGRLGLHGELLPGPSEGVQK